jgi:hypothetical protein
MSKRVESDEEDPTAKKKKKRPRTRSTSLSKPETAKKPQLRSRKAQNEEPEPNSLISIWARRELFASQEVIDEVEIASPRKVKTAFPIDYGNPVLRKSLKSETEEIPSVPQLAVHKNKIEELFKWLRGFPDHQKVHLTPQELT